MFGFNRSKQRLSRQLHTLNEQVNALATQVERLADGKRTATVTIEHLAVEQAYLDELTFRLDSLDIEELSGSLNLGNNFHPKVTHTSVKRPANSSTDSGGTGGGTGSLLSGISGLGAPRSPSETTENAKHALAGSEPPSTQLVDGRQMNATTNGYLITLS